MYEVFEILLQKFNVTTYQVSKATGISQSTFSNWKSRFDVQKDMEPDDLRALHNMALALKRKERGNIDDTGC